jgi:hypothetical protein
VLLTAALEEELSKVAHYHELIEVLETLDLGAE